jgi:hypothetical protein
MENKIVTDGMKLALIDNVLNYVPDVNDDKLERIQMIMNMGNEKC